MWEEAGHPGSPSALGCDGRAEMGPGNWVSHNPGEHPKRLIFSCSGMSFCLISLGQKLHPEAEKLFPVKAMLASVYLAACWCLFFFYFFNEKGK